MEHVERQDIMTEELIQNWMVVRWAVSLGSSAVVSMRERDRLELPSKIGEIQYILESDVLQQSDKQYSANDLSATFNQKSVNGESVLLAKASNTVRAEGG